MKKIALGLMAAFIGFSAMAQTPDKTNDPSTTQKTRKPFKANGNYEKLNLTDQQKSEVKDLNQSLTKDLNDLKSQNLAQDELKAKRRELLKQHQEKVQAILTPEQRQQAETLKEQYKDQKMADGGRRNARAEQMVKDLNLTPDQTTKVKSLNEDVAKTLKGIRENSSLNEDQKKEQTKVVLKKHREDLQSILTPEQREQLKSKFKGGKGDSKVPAASK